MYEDASLILLADNQRVNIWRDDVRLLMPHVPRVDIVLSDPPYQWFTSMEDLDRQDRLAGLHPELVGQPAVNVRIRPQRVLFGHLVGKPGCAAGAEQEYRDQREEPWDNRTGFFRPSPFSSSQ